MNNDETFLMIAKTMYGLEEILSNELKKLGAEEIEIGRRMVSFKGDKKLLYAANIHLRTALRILVPIDTFEAQNADEVYQYLYDHVDWSKYLTPRKTFAFDAVVYSDKFTHSKFLAYRAKDAIADFFRDRNERRPNVSVVDPEVKFHIHISHTTVTIALDSSGESLHRRGYRVGQNDAPISEVLAAGILLRAGWDGSCDLVDPMCGSGTFLTEAAMIALNIPPGIFREHYAFERWEDFDEELLCDVLDEWEEQPFDHMIYGSDASPKAIAISRANIQKAGLKKAIELMVKPIEEWEPGDKPSDNGLLVCNPPYGMRMKPSDIEKLYGTLGSKLKHVFTGYKAWIISAGADGFDAIGLKQFVREKLYNGAIECELRAYEMFEGKRDDFVKEKIENNEHYERGENTEPSTTRQYTRGERREGFENNRLYDTDRNGDRSFRSKNREGVGGRSRRRYGSDGASSGDKPFGNRRYGGDRRYDNSSKGGDRRPGGFRRSERLNNEEQRERREFFREHRRGFNNDNENNETTNPTGERTPRRRTFVPRSNKERKPQDD